jgi:deoxycytidine triphosphate deaminase
VIVDFFNGLLSHPTIDACNIIFILIRSHGFFVRRTISHAKDGEAMSLLDDRALVANVTGTGKPLVTNLKAKNGQWFDAESPIQACSVDLHIGKIFIPGKSGKDEGSQDSPLDLHTLESGQTAVVSTLEDLCLPHDISAIGFPPNRISVQGILMTNPGHIDPGYSGPMRFTIINMGKTHFVLRREDPIVTLLFMKLSQPVQKD